MHTQIARFVGTGAPIPIDGGEGYLWGWTVRCSRCGNPDRVTTNKGNPLPPEQIIKKLTQKGWAIAKRADHDVCPECLAEDRRHREVKHNGEPSAPLPPPPPKYEIPPPRFVQSCQWVVIWLNNLGARLDDEQRTAVTAVLKEVVTVAQNVGIDLGVALPPPEDAPTSVPQEGKSDLLRWLDQVAEGC